MATYTMALNNSNLLLVLPTGGGKSVLPFLHMHLNSANGQVVLLIVPLKSLLGDLQRRADEMNVPCRIWDPSFRLNDSEESCVIIVSVEMASMDTFSNFAMNLEHRGILNRIFIDEAHVYISQSHFRAAIDEVPAIISSLSSPVTLMSATVPVSIENTLTVLFGMNRQFDKIRASTAIPWHAFKVLNIAKQESFKVCLLRNLKTEWQASIAGDRQVVFAPTKALVEEVAEYLEDNDIPSSIYYARNDEDYGDMQRKQALESWSHGESVLVATSAFGLGVDYKKIRSVYIYAGCFSLLDFVQLAGRAGRDGNQSNIVLISNPQTLQEYLNKGIHLKTRESYLRECSFLQSMFSRETCRRMCIGTELDGQTTTCGMLLEFNVSPCDVCLKFLPVPERPQNDEQVRVVSSQHPRQHVHQVYEGPDEKEGEISMYFLILLQINSSSYNG